MALKGKMIRWSFRYVSVCAFVGTGMLCVFVCVCMCLCVCVCEKKSIAGGRRGYLSNPIVFMHNADDSFRTITHSSSKIHTSRKPVEYSLESTFLNNT